MPGRVLILDTSILCCLLEIPGKETCGAGERTWNKIKVEDFLDREKKSTLVLPLACIIETGNHISQSPSQRFDLAKRLAKYISAAADGTSPWAAFTEQAVLWTPEKLNLLASTWPDLAAAKISIADATIKDVAEFYARASFDVEIWTGDAGLKAYQPLAKPLRPRRRLSGT